MFRLLVAAFGPEGYTYVRQARKQGVGVKVLDCFDKYHRRLIRWYGDDALQVPARRSDVRTMAAQQQFDAAIVHEDTDFVHAALITQSLREAGIPRILVVTRDASKRAMYRRCGANRVIVADTAEEAWATMNRYLPSFQTA
ncbi:hypothetical protein JI721_08620 [Alicyclobacillus cycloheptanicus]|uniref:Trk K+ transport system NAD-binding subunit n=1 Tax=Alicyclobacillus cycloheptanicus TaxID=1457 RepID=A0ABT9XKD6_9BACL|nr:NAD-binding protein [Alicyclobacillus cycloheptanicus]MDQ0190761.1 Trk K+ transport system NAD-binding subunit [Alicyclobacillus cycloheptanicus]WDL99854.1 hypothetical protein JI721_08620 [Alicyclobacillus cycloheptanicus]